MRHYLHFSIIIQLKVSSQILMSYNATLNQNLEEDEIKDS